MKLNPTQPFAGSSHVTDGLGLFRRLIRHAPDAGRASAAATKARKIAGLAAGLGYEADVATNGRRAFELAVALARLRAHADPLAHRAAAGRRVGGPVAPRPPHEPVARRPDRAAGRSGADRALRPQRAADRGLPAAAKRRRNEAVRRRGAGALEALARAGRRAAGASRRGVDWLARLADRPQKVFDVRRQEPAIVQALCLAAVDAQGRGAVGPNGHRQLRSATCWNWPIWRPSRWPRARRPRRPSPPRPPATACC